jgi:hypothetical protein
MGKRISIKPCFQEKIPLIPGIERFMIITYIRR